MTPILFPNLGLEVTIPQVAFSLFGKEIYWYGIIIASGILLSIAIAYRRREKQSIPWDTIMDFVLVAIPVGIVCARLYYVIFKWDYYSQHLAEIFQIWNGGLAIYGAVIGGIATAFIFCKIRKISFLELCDYCAPYLALCQSIGRWGNFVNQEAYGQVTDSFLKMGIYDASLQKYIYVQPTFLYESVCTFLIFVTLMYLQKHKKFSGQLFYLYMILYGMARAVIEGFRSDSLYLGPIRISQLLSLLFSTIFAVLYAMTRKKLHKKS